VAISPGFVSTVEIAIGLPWPATLSALWGKLYLPGIDKFRKHSRRGGGVIFQ
jgi:hypothetical protein